MIDESRIIVVDTLTRKEISIFPAENVEKATEDYNIVTKRMSDFDGRYRWSMQVKIGEFWFDRKNRFTHFL